MQDGDATHAALQAGPDTAGRLVHSSLFPKNIMFLINLHLASGDVVVAVGSVVAVVVVAAVVVAVVVVAVVVVVVLTGMPGVVGTSGKQYCWSSAGNIKVQFFALIRMAE